MSLEPFVSFFFHDPATTEIYTLSLHDALPICRPSRRARGRRRPPRREDRPLEPAHGDRKSTRLNSSHANISYAVFCLKKKKHKSTGTDTHVEETQAQNLHAHDAAKINTRVVQT